MKSEDSLVAQGWEGNPLVEVSVDEVPRKKFLWEIVPDAEKKDQDLNGEELFGRIGMKYSVPRHAFTESELKENREEFFKLAKDCTAEELVATQVVNADSLSAECGRKIDSGLNI